MRTTLILSDVSNIYIYSLTICEIHHNYARYLHYIKTREYCISHIPKTHLKKVLKMAVKSLTCCQKNHPKFLKLTRFINILGIIPNISMYVDNQFLSFRLSTCTCL